MAMIIIMPRMPAKAASFAKDLSFGLPQDGDKSGIGK